MKTVLAACLLLVLPLLTAAQHRIPSLDTLRGKSYFILLLDGGQLHGRIIRQDTTMLTVRLVNGQRTYVESALFDRISLTAPAPVETYFQSDAIVPTLPQSQTQPNPTMPYLFRLRDGTSLRGFVVRLNAEQTVIRTKSLGEVALRTDQITRMEQVDSLEEPLVTYLFPQWMPFIPTAFTAEPGRWSYRNTSLLFHQFEYGATKNLSLGTTFFVFPGLYLLSLNAKLTVPVGPQLRVGVSGQYVTAGFGIGNTNSGSFGIVQAMATAGTPRRNLTVSYGTITTGDAFGKAGLLTVGFMLPISKTLLLISQNSFATGSSSSKFFSTLSGGLRIQSKQHAFDISTFIPYFGSSLSSGLSILGSYQVKFPSSLNNRNRTLQLP